MPTKNAGGGNEKIYFAKRTHLKVPVQSPEKEKVKTQKVSARVLSSRERASFAAASFVNRTTEFLVDFLGVLR